MIPLRVLLGNKSGPKADAHTTHVCNVSGTHSACLQAKSSVADLSGDLDDYRRIQRTRAKKVSEMLERPDTVHRLSIASVMIAPAERIMSLA